MFSESTRFLFVEMSLTLYEHGYKETAQNSIVIVINPSKGILCDRTQDLMEVVRNAGAIVFEIVESEFDEIYSPLASIIAFFFMALI